ncbi:MAG: MBL fold metallo-hydrolase [Gammaproteobacteria bacterium]|nr:MBL fold metallo-hydrolase [Gammaproteobacteria bacterium]
MKHALLCGATVAALLLSGPGSAGDGLELQVIPTSETSMYANMVLLKGEQGAVLVDTPFSRADAHRVVAAILDSGKRLETIIVTHDHPDHFFGLDVLTDAFPAARVLAHPAVVEDMRRSVPIKFERWSPMLGTNAPQRQVVPSPLTGDEISLEGHVLKIIGPMQGDHVHATAVWDPQSRTLIAGDLLFNGVHVWLGEHLPAQYAAWRKSLDALAALQPARIVAGHSRPGLHDDSYAMDWTRQYILAFEQAASAARTSKELADTLHALYPHAVDVADGFIVGISSQVATGEIPPWDE